MIKLNQKGFTLIETLIAMIVLTVGLLGAVALQANAKKASYDSLQRSAALALANDIVQRISANDTTDAANVVTMYGGKTIKSSQTPTTSDSCFSAAAGTSASCSSAQIAEYDLNEWRKAISAQDKTGALSDAIVCINPTANGTTGIDLEVIVTWTGKQEIKQDVNSGVTCGTTGDKRRIVVVNSFIFIRA